MLKLPVLDKNAYLSILITNGEIHSQLSFADYTIPRTYILKDTTQVLNITDIYQKSFWSEYFDALEGRFNWNVFRARSGQIMNFAAEGIGVTSVSIHILDRGMSAHSIVSAIREYSSEVSIKMIGNEYIKSLLDGFESRLGYNDVTILDLNLTSFHINRLSKKTKKRYLSGPINRESVYASGKINWSSKEKLLNIVTNAKLKAFLSIDSTTKKISNTWANYVLYKPVKTDSELLTDIIRSYITVQLLSIKNEHKGQFENIGEDVDSTAIFLTGDLIDILPVQLLLLAIIDGLELLGAVDIFIQRNGTLYTLGRNYTSTDMNSEFVITPFDLFSEVYKVVMPSIDSKKEGRKVIMNGRIDSEKGEDSDIFAVAPEFTHIPIKNSEDRLAVELKLINSAYIDKYGEKLSFISNPSKVHYNGIVVDGRYKPVVYGPDFRNNRVKLIEWFNEATW